MTFDLFLSRTMLLVFGWWMLPLIAIADWVFCLGPVRLTLGECFSIAASAWRSEWAGNK